MERPVFRYKETGEEPEVEDFELYPNAMCVCGLPMYAHGRYGECPVTEDEIEYRRGDR
jgi:hypothetical protein